MIKNPSVFDSDITCHKYYHYLNVRNDLIIVLYERKYTAKFRLQSRTEVYLNEDSS